MGDTKPRDTAHSIPDGLHRPFPRKTPSYRRRASRIISIPDGLHRPFPRPDDLREMLGLLISIPDGLHRPFPRPDDLREMSGLLISIPDGLHRPFPRQVPRAAPGAGRIVVLRGTRQNLLKWLRFGLPLFTIHYGSPFCKGLRSRSGTFGSFARQRAWQDHHFVPRKNYRYKR